jgi:transposase InsO family protein
MTHLLADGSNYNLYVTDLKMFLTKDQRNCLYNTPGTGPHDSNLESLTKLVMLSTMDGTDKMAAWDMPTAHEVWTYLQDKYQPSSVLGQYSSMTGFLANTLNDGDLVVTYVAKVGAAKREAEQHGNPISDIQHAVQLLAGLRGSWIEFREVFLASQSENMTTTKVVSALRDRERSKRMQGPMETTYVANPHQYAVPSAHHQPPQQPYHQQSYHQHQQPQLPRQCAFCGLNGHFMIDCHKYPQGRAYRPSHGARGGRGGRGGARGGRGGRDGGHGGRENGYVANEDWLVDSGASSSITGNNAVFDQYSILPHPIPIVVGNGETIHAIGKGDATIRIAKSKMKLKEVLHVPGIAHNLISVSKLTDDNKHVIFDQNKATVVDTRTNETVGVATRTRNLYVLNSQRQLHLVAALVATDLQTQQEWHQRLGHPSNARLREMVSKNMADDLPTFKVDMTWQCTACMQGKAKAQPFPRSTTRASKPLELVHSDIAGPYPETITKKRYLLTITDDHTAHSWTRLLRTKDEAWPIIEDFHMYAERQHNHKLKVLRTDNGGEYVSARSAAYCAKYGIKHEKTIPYTPQQNGTAERLNLTLFNIIRTVLAESKLPNALWGEAAMWATYTKNRLPTKAGQPNKTPYKALHGTPPTVRHMHAFGSTCYVRIITNSKLNIRSIEGRMVGYDEFSKAYRVYIPSNHRIVLARNVDFKHNKPTDPINSTLVEVNPIDSTLVEVHPFDSTNVEVHPIDSTNVEVPPYIDDNDTAITIPLMDAPIHDEDAAHLNPNPIPMADDPQPIQDDAEPIVPEMDIPEVVEPNPNVNRLIQVFEPRAIRQRQHPQTEKFSAENASYNPGTGKFALAIQERVTPSTYEEAISGPDKKKWSVAMDDEMQSLHDNNTWMLVNLPHGRRALDGKWVYRIKLKVDGELERFKARFVLRGFQQREGVDFKETYCPTVKATTIRLLLALAAVKDYEADQMDVKTAFLNGDLEEEVYMEQPLGYVVKGQERKVCLLKKALYGLKQAPRQWYQKLHTFLISSGFVRCAVDHGLYVRHDESGALTIMGVYVDDLLLVASTKNAMQTIKDQLSTAFSMSDLGPVNYLLGMRITRNRTNHTIQIDQTKYINEKLAQYNMADCKERATPLEQPDGDETTTELLDLNRYPYRSAVGSLIYLATCTRPDIAHAVGELGRHMQAPRQSHWAAVKRVFQYLQGTKQHTLTYGTNSSMRPTAYADASWGTFATSMRSTTGFVLMVAGGAIAWRSRRAATTMISTQEAEIAALSEAVEETIWITSMMKILGEEEKPLVYCDNQATISLVTQGKMTTRNRTVAMKHQRIIEQCSEEKLFDVEYIQTDWMVADALTKAVNKPKLQYCREGMGVVKHLSSGSVGVYAMRMTVSQ